jgi:PAS domain S-box-containing protein
MAEHISRTENQGLLQTLIDSLPDYIFIKDQQSRFLVNNLAHVQSLGAAHPDEVLGKTDLDIFPVELAQQFYADEQAVMKSGQQLDREETVVHPQTGKTRWLQTTKTPLRDEDGRIVGLVGISRDITDRKRAEEELRQVRAQLEQQVADRTVELSRERRLLRTLIDNLPDGIYAKDAAGRKTLANPADLKVLGCQTEAEAIGKTDFDFFPQAVAAKFFADDQSVIQQCKPVLNREEYYFDAENQKRWLLTSKLPIEDTDGKIIGLVGISRDITKRKRTEEALAHANRQLQAMLDNIPDRIYFKDTQSRFLKCNQALAKHLGLENPELAVGKTDFDFYPPEKAREFYQNEQEIIQTGQPLIDNTVKVIKPTGEISWASVTKVPLRDGDGKITGLVGISRDVTEQKRAEDALRQSHDELEQRVAERTTELSRERLLLRTLIDNLPDCIYAKDTAGRKTLANPADLKNLRCKTEAEAIGKTDFDLFPHDIAVKFVADDRAVVQSGQPVINREEFFFDEEGRQRWLLTSKLPMCDQNGTVVGLMGIGRDITSLKEAEQKLEQTHRDLRTASRYAGMAEVATGVLHNVGNVLNSVNVSAAMIAERLRDSKSVGVSKLAKLLQEHSADVGRFLAEDERGRQVPSYLQQLAEHLERERAELRGELETLTLNIEHIKEIVATQQNYARISGVTETVLLSSLVEDAIKIHGGAYARHGVTVVREFDPLPTVSVDKHKVLQILVNLLHNAKYACDAGGRDDKQVIVRLKAAAEGRVKIEVADNGVGIAAENLTRIFSQGFTTRKGGHGFGLHSGALAARELGGSLSVHSAGPGLGATFILELPITPQQHKREKS